MAAYNGGIGGLPTTPAFECQPDAQDCGIVHSATGWCNPTTGQPVILLVRMPCEDDAAPVVITLDASTGDQIDNGPVVPCGDSDWEVNTLCDVDPLTGQTLATVVQIFHWDETTQTLVRTLERADLPGVPYVPVGQLQTCSGGQLQAVVQQVCATDGDGDRLPLTEVVLLDTLDGTIRHVFYIDSEANAVTPLPDWVFAVGDCHTPDLPLILVELETANGHLTTIINEVNDVEELLTSANGKLDTMIANNAACCTQTNANLTTIIGHVDGLEGLVTTSNNLLTTIIGHVDGVEALLTSIDGRLIVISNQMAVLIGHVDGVEALITATNAELVTSNARLQTIIGHVDGIEALLGTSNTNTGTVVTRLTPSVFTGNGQTAVGVAAVQLSAGSIPAQKGLIVKAKISNTGLVYVGNTNGVTVGTGFELGPGDSVTLPITNANLVWLIASAAAQAVTWVVV